MNCRNANCKNGQQSKRVRNGVAQCGCFGCIATRCWARGARLAGWLSWAKLAGRGEKQIWQANTRASKMAQYSARTNIYSKKLGRCSSSNLAPLNHV